MADHAAPPFFGFLKNSFQDVCIKSPLVEHTSLNGGQRRGSRQERESMIFYAIFWTTYLPFVVLTLSLLADRLTHHTESDAATQTKPVPAPAKPSGRARKDAGAAK
jgi:hypothetical protein